jgi:hypothetical protein
VGDGGLPARLARDTPPLPAKLALPSPESWSLPDPQRSTHTCRDYAPAAICLPSACHLPAICLPSACHLLAICLPCSEGDLIKHDNDVDLAVLDPDWPQLVAALRAALPPGKYSLKGAPDRKRPRLLRRGDDVLGRVPARLSLHAPRAPAVLQWSHPRASPRAAGSGCTAPWACVTCLGPTSRPQSECNHEFAAP